MLTFRPTVLSLYFSSVLAGTLATGCVSTGTHEKVIAELDLTKTALASTRSELGKTSEDLKKTLADKKACDAEAAQCSDELGAAMLQNNTLASRVAAVGGEKESLAQERAKLAKEVQDLRRMREAAEARNKAFRTVLEKLHKMIDAGTLEVKIRNGRMLVTMSSDVLFPPGGTKLKPEAEEAIRELAQTIAGFPNRKFQVVGHSDATPIHSKRFPSNWELSSQRAIEVVKVMVDAGVPPEMLTPRAPPSSIPMEKTTPPRTCWRTAASSAGLQPEH
ncbi:MAG: OmpA family protein [Myxococcota bacterium]